MTALGGRKIVECNRYMYKGHIHGDITIDALTKDEDEDTFDDSGCPRECLRAQWLLFKNENLLCRLTDDTGSESVIACVPDLMCP